MIVFVILRALAFAPGSSSSFSGTTCGLRAAVGAALFAASDIFVARDRFAAPGWRNRAAGLPLYYGAQLVLAGTLLH